MADPGKGSEGSQAPTPPISDLVVYKGLVIIHHPGGGGGGRGGDWKILAMSR